MSPHDDGAMIQRHEELLTEIPALRVEHRAMKERMDMIADTQRQVVETQHETAMSLLNTVRDVRDLTARMLNIERRPAQTFRRFVAVATLICVVAGTAGGLVGLVATWIQTAQRGATP